MWMAIGMGCMAETLEELSENMREAIDDAYRTEKNGDVRERLLLNLNGVDLSQ
jgi:hypothetical protein